MAERGAYLLVADDNKVNRLLLSRSLEVLALEPVKRAFDWDDAEEMIINRAISAEKTRPRNRSAQLIGKRRLPSRDYQSTLKAGRAPPSSATPPLRSA